jgi:hypothetical protein
MISVSGFKSEKLKKLNLNCVHAIILDWVVYFARSNKQFLLSNPNDDEKYYWVKYSKIYADIPLPFDSNYLLNKCFDNLTGNNDPKYPLIKKVFHTKSGNMVGLAIRENVIAWLKGSEGSMDTCIGLFDTPIQNKNKINGERKTKLNKNAFYIINSLSKLKKEDGDNLFSMVFPKDEKHYSKSIYNFQNQLLDLYEGKFYKNYIYNIADWFSLKYKWYITDESKKLIQNCKDSWENIEKLILNSCKNLSLWYNVNTELTDKDKLPKNISTFIYNSFSKISMFYICLIKPPSEVREASTDSLYKTIDSVVRNEMKIVKKNDWDGYSFWNRVKKIQDYYDKNNLNVKYQYWLGNGIQEFIIGYKEFLIGLTGGLEFVNLGNVGTGNKTWEAFLNNKKEEFSI